MATTSKYFLLPSTGANFIDFELSYGSVSLQGQEIVFVGSTTVDAVFVRPGVVVDMTLSGAGADKIYLSGNQAELGGGMDVDGTLADGGVRLEVGDVPPRLRTQVSAVANDVASGRLATDPGD